MASNRDVLEAQRFNRRRLVAAFSSGTPSGREIEPSSGLRPLLVGGVISLVMLGVALVMGKFSPTLPDGWQNSTTIVVSSTGARFYTVDGVLRPIANITSAKLLSDPGNYHLSRVSSGTIEGIPRGSRIGLDAAPDDVPASSELGSGEWTACALDGGTRTWVAQTPSSLSSADAALVKNANTLYLVVDGTRHRIDNSTNSGVLIALHLDSAPVTEVGADWLDLFERGSDLTALEIDGAGTPVAGMPPALSSAVIGTVIEIRDDTGSAAREYVVTGDRRIAPLTDTGARLYRISRSSALAGNALKASLGDLATLDVDPNGVVVPDWPASIGAVTAAADAPCASLVFDDDGAHSRLMSVPADIPEASPPSSDKAVAGVSVKGGSGALVKATAGGDFGITVFVSDFGLQHALGTDPTDSLGRLGWQVEDIKTVPAAWVALIPEGTALTSDAAWQTVAVQ